MLCQCLRGPMPPPCSSDPDCDSFRYACRIQGLAGCDSMSRPNSCSVVHIGKTSKLLCHGSQGWRSCELVWSVGLCPLGVSCCATGAPTSIMPPCARSLEPCLRSSAVWFCCGFFGAGHCANGLL
jgi:hypothetical protein